MADIKVVPSTLEVDFDTNLTDLYKAITDTDWDKAVVLARKHPLQAATWVVRHYETEDDTDDDDEHQPREIMWRFLPLHSACARQPTAAVVSALLRAYPDAPKCVDDQGMYALHYACGNQASRDVIRQLLVNFPEAAKIPDPRGMLPIHYLACWGPSSLSVVDMVLVANRDIEQAKDDEGNTAMDLALEGDYPERDQVVACLKKWLASSNHSVASAPPDDASSRASVPSTLTGPSGSRLSGKARSVAVDKPEEEKKEERDDVSTSSPIIPESPLRAAAKMAASVAAARTSSLRPFISPDEVKRLQEQIRSLESAKQSKEREWEKKFAAAEAAWKKKVEELEFQNERQAEDIEVARAEAKDLQDQLDIKVDKLQQNEFELKTTRQKLQDARGELKGLQVTLGDMMEQHQTFEKKTGHMNDRLGSLAASLSSMLEQQTLLSKTVKDRKESRAKSYQARQHKLHEIMELERESEDDDDRLDVSLKKQSREMEAIAAVIAAARE